MTQPKPTKPGNVTITRTGQTFGAKFGITPDVKAKGSDTVSDAVFGKGN